MEKNFANMSLIDIAYEMVKESEDGLEISELLSKTLEAAGLDSTDAETLSNLYMEICTSSKFVFLTTKKWDLKTRHSLDEYDKDGSKFVNAEESEEEDLDLGYVDDEEDDDYDDEDEEDDEDDEEDDDEDDEEDDLIDRDSEDSYSDSDEEDDYTDDSDDDLSEFDEEKYNSTMDEYEDKYDN